MSITQLKKAMKEGQSFQSQEYGGTNTLYDVLLAMANRRVGGYQATIATGVLDGFVAEKPLKLYGLSAKALVCGTAGSTVLQVKKNGTLIPGATLTIDNADADGTFKTVALAADIATGDIVTVEVTTAPTAGTGLAATALVSDVDTHA